MEITVNVTGLDNLANAIFALAKTAGNCKEETQVDATNIFDGTVSSRSDRSDRCRKDAGCPKYASVFRCTDSDGSATGEVWGVCICDQSDWGGDLRWPRKENMLCYQQAERCSGSTVRLPQSCVMSFQIQRVLIPKKELWHMRSVS